MGAQGHIVQWKVAPESLGRLDWPLPAQAVQAVQEAPTGGTGPAGCLSLACRPAWEGPLVGDAAGRIWQLSVRAGLSQPCLLAGRLACLLACLPCCQPS